MKPGRPIYTTLLYLLTNKKMKILQWLWSTWVERRKRKQSERTFRQEFYMGADGIF